MSDVGLRTVHKLLDDFKIELEEAEDYALIDLFYIPTRCFSPCGFHGAMFTSPGCASGESEDKLLCL